MKTSAECMQGAFAALLRGDLKERDRLCDRAEQLITAEERAAKITKVLSVDFYVTATGVVISSKHMAKVARVIQ